MMYLRTLRHSANPSRFVRFDPSLCSLSRFASTETSTQAKVSKPLRILFCGSDTFSAASLRALYAEQQRNPDGIRSIDVMVRPGKRSGRGMKIRDVPLKSVADELGLTVHERDTFTGWELPRPLNEPINLIVAVSFGLFVPPRILNSAEYGGLNVHPSLLPNFRGPAPLQHQIMRGTKVFGVSLQTLDEKTFDKGIILDQTSQREAAKFKQMCGDCNYDILLKNITPKGAEILVKGIRNRVFVPPLVHRSWYQKTDIVHAPKITAADRQVDFRQQSASAIDKNVRALGRLWCNVFLDAHNTKRLVFEDFETVPVPQAFKGWVAARRQKSTPPEETEVHKNVARLLVYRDRNDEAQVQIYVEDGDAIIIRIRNHAIRVREITVEGQQKKSAAKVMRGFDASEHWRVQWRARHGLWIERIQRDSNLERARAITEAIAKGRKHEL